MNTELVNVLNMDDKLKHMIVGFFIGIITFIIYYRISKDLKYSIVASIAMGLLAGGYKEIIDIDGGTVDIKDIISTVLGSSIGSSLIGIIYLFKYQ